MDTNQFLTSYWKRVLTKDKLHLRQYFAPGATINWHCTNEQFTVDEFLTANCDYPGDWNGAVERIETHESTSVTVVRVWNTEGLSFHVTSFFLIEDTFITELDEYWADDSQPPAWRRSMKIGQPIR